MSSPLGEDYLSMADIAKRLDRLSDTVWTTKKARRWMVKNGCHEKFGGRFYVSKHKFKTTFPEVYDRLGFDSGDQKTT